MPVYRQTYRTFEGHMVRRFRWWIVMEQELRVLWGFRIFKFLAFLALLHVLLRALQIFAYDIIRQDPNHLLTPLLNQATFLMINKQMFFDFISLQTPLMYLTLLYAGSGMICNDFRNNLIDVYFSKPIRWYDYVLGKLFALVIVGLGITAFPAYALILMHNMLLPSTDLLFETLSWVYAVSFYSLALVVSCATSVLASSSLIKSQSYAAIIIVMLTVVISAVAVLLKNSSTSKIIGYSHSPISLDFLGRMIFKVGGVPFDVPFYWLVLYLLAVIIGGLWILAHKIRHAEVAH